MLDFNIFLESKPILYTLIFLGVVLGIVWLLSIYWVYQDIFKRTRNVVLQVISIVLAIIFPFFGLLMYSLVKPPLTLEEKKLQILDEKIIKKQLGGLFLCPNCHRSIEDDYLFCPYCKTKVKDSCPRCDKPVDKKFLLCPYCGYETRQKSPPQTASSQNTNSKPKKKDKS